MAVQAARGGNVGKAKGEAMALEGGQSPTNGEDSAKRSAAVYPAASRRRRRWATEKSAGQFA